MFGAGVDDLGQFLARRPYLGGDFGELLGGHLRERLISAATTAPLRAHLEHVGGHDQRTLEDRSGTASGYDGRSGFGRRTMIGSGRVDGPTLTFLLPVIF